MAVASVKYEFKEHGIISHPEMEVPWDAELFQQNFCISIISMKDTMEFDMINVNCCFPNAVRRALLAEVPSVCIERVYLHQNTSIMPDEVLCHRLGLIPLNVDPKLLSFPAKALPLSDELPGFNSKEHLLFDLHAQFSKNDARLPNSRSGKDLSTEPAIPTVRSRAIYSSSIKWCPLPGQEETFVPTPPAVVSDSILINKLSVGDEIEARCLAVKGVGRDHAKFSPVCAAYYKFMPVIDLLQPIEGELAKKLQASFAPGVIGIHPDTHEAFVLNPRLDNGSREHLRHPEFRDGSVIFVGVDASHCIFTVESVTPDYRPPARLVREAIDIMISKCLHYLAITEAPGFGYCSANETKPKKSLDSQSTNANTNSDVGTTRSQLNGREVSLEVTHMSPDKKRTTYTFYGEDHTLGLVLRYCVLHSTNATFCGYCVPHPLEDKIHFDIQVSAGTATDALRAGLQCMHACFSHMKNAFKSAVTAFKRTEHKL
ncbi:DNA directed RNA polymerases I and III subunit [Fasciola gigantica]|uniref:DNA directed RNA polymerases I and III subunit n=1 Tax=Fasciola gigantica TaxID=46835 RepID=A0A504YR40_FASGI|nr:DNA directed RNA polymerases I and III subunit [Fasciola gigantica]